MRSPPRSIVLALVEENLYAHVLQSGDEADRVVIAEHAVDRSVERGANFRHSGKRGLIGAIGLAAVVAGEHAKVVVDPLEKRDHPLHRGFAHIDMEVAELKDGEAVEGLAADAAKRCGYA